MGGAQRMKKILAIDDKKDNLVTISAVLNSYMDECEVITAMSGAAGIELAASAAPDVIVLDVKMPGMDGYEVCRYLKSRDETRHIPVILLTAIKTDTESRIKGLETGADAFLTKPIDESELIAQINVMIRIKKSEDLLRGEKALLENLVAERTAELRESRDRLKRERDFLNSLGEASPAYYAAVDTGGLIINMNRALLAALGMDAGTALRTHFLDLFPAGDREVMEASLHATADDGDSGQFICGFKGDDGRARRVEWQGRGVRSSGPGFDFLFFVGIDISERVRLEQIILENDEMRLSTLGRDLHDGVGQHLAAIAFKAEVVKLKLAGGSIDGYDEAAEISELSVQAMNMTRDLAKALSPVSKNAGGLASALEELAGEAGSMGGPVCLARVDRSVEPASETEASHLYSIAREAVLNSVAHSGAKNIIISLEYSGGSIVLSVTDDGRGIDMSAGRGDGAGIGSMRYRAWVIGGAFFIGRNERGGTVVMVTLKSGASASDRPAAAGLAGTAGSMGAKILIVDDHPVVRSGLIHILGGEKGLTVAGEARGADEAVRKAANLEPDLMIVDITLEGAGGLELISALKTRFPSMPVLVLSAEDEAIYGERVIQAGARGYLMKSGAPQKIIEAVRSLLAGKHYYSDMLRERIINRFHTLPEGGTRQVASLTNREFEVFQCLGNGMGNRHIAEKLSLSVKTVENYRERIKNKLNIESSTDLVQFAVKWVIEQSGSASPR
jgi:PAS domain S-box-containing protein